MSKRVRTFVAIAAMLGIVFAGALSASAQEIIPTDHGCSAYVHEPSRVNLVGHIWQAKGDTWCDRNWGVINMEVRLVAAYNKSGEYIPLSSTPAQCANCLHIDYVYAYGTCIAPSTYFRTRNEVRAVAPETGELVSAYAWSYSGIAEDHSCVTSPIHPD